MPSWLDPERIIMTAGPYALWVVAFIVFAECGLFSLLPGDSLLFTVGMFVALGAVNYGSHLTTMVIVCAVLTFAAVVGNMSGYYLGKLIGPPLFKPRQRGLMAKVFDPRYVDMTHDFFEKYGPRALILARFVPMVRTFVTLVAGIAKMRFGTFIAYTAIGGVLWVCGITILGFFLGQIKFIHDNLEVALILIVVVSVIPMFVEYFNARRKGKAEVKA